MTCAAAAKAASGSPTAWWSVSAALSPSCRRTAPANEAAVIENGRQRADLETDRGDRFPRRLGGFGDDDRDGLPDVANTAGREQGAVGGRSPSSTVDRRQGAVAIKIRRREDQCDAGEALGGRHVDRVDRAVRERGADDRHGERPRGWCARRSHRGR